MRNYYHDLGLSEGASLSDIKRAYRNLAKKYHPDINSAPLAREKFIAITEAYECLTDPGKRMLNERKYRHKSYGNSSTAQWTDPAFEAARREKARRQAEAFARMNFETFKETNTFKSTVRHYIPQFTGCFIAGIFTLGLMSLAFKFSIIAGTIVAFLALPVIAILFQIWEDWRKRI